MPMIRSVSFQQIVSFFLQCFINKFDEKAIYRQIKMKQLISSFITGFVIFIMILITGDTIAFPALLYGFVGFIDS